MKLSNIIDINDIVNDVQDDMYDTLNKMYMKQHMIMESDDSLDLSSFQCFQEGLFPAKSKEFDVFNFDNKHLMKAIKYFNKAYSELPLKKYPDFLEYKKAEYNGDLNKAKELYPKGINSELKTEVANWQKTSKSYRDAFIEIEKQFNIKFCIMRSDKISSIGTIPKLITMKEGQGKLTISKEKGFQLGGMIVNLIIGPEYLLYLAPENPNMFGQNFTGIMLHEIYHNIVRMVEVRNTDLYKNIKKTFADSPNDLSPKEINKNTTSFINRFISDFDISKMEFKKDKATRLLRVLSNIKDNPVALDKFEKDINNNEVPDADKELDKYIDTLNQLSKRIRFNRTKHIIKVVCIILGTAICAGTGAVAGAVVGSVYLALLSLKMIMKKVVMFLVGGSERLQEEYFCDLFAAMYKLPVHFTSFKRQIELNKINPDKIKEINKADMELSKTLKDPHPLIYDRELASYRIAKQMLADKNIKLKKDVRKYLEYIVKTNEGIEDLDVPRGEYADKIDPEAAADLRKTMKDFIEKTGVTVTESFVDEICNEIIGDYYD